MKLKKVEVGQTLREGSEKGYRSRQCLGRVNKLGEGIPTPRKHGNGAEE